MSAVELARVPSGLPAGRPSPAVAIEVVPGVRVPKAAELVAAELRGRIVSGELGDGAALPVEAVLMAAFGVSRPTLREAFRVLDLRGAALTGVGVCVVVALFIDVLEESLSHRFTPARGR